MKAARENGKNPNIPFSFLQQGKASGFQRFFNVFATFFQQKNRFFQRFFSLPSYGVCGKLSLSEEKDVK